MSDNKKVEDYLNEVDYSTDSTYIPKDASLNFINFIKLINGEQGESNKSPVTHYKLMDNIFSKKSRLAILCHRGFSKSSLLMVYLPFYIAVFGKLDNFGIVNYILAVLDSAESGGKTMRKSMEIMWENSDFLQKYLPKTRFTDAFIELENIEGHRLGIKIVGAQMGIRGTRFTNKNGNHRPEIALLDDILSDIDAKSPTVIANIENTIHKAVDKALNPGKNKIVYIGTVFSQSDPLYKVIESGRWSPSVYPVCEKFPCSEKEFRGSWEDRFPYDVVKKMYEDALALGRMSDFNGEMMNRVISEEDRLILDCDISWFKRSTVLNNKEKFNFYITTDFATSERTSADFSVISVWAYNTNGDWLWVDGICKRQMMDKNVDDLFRLSQQYKPQQVGVEVSGQQGGFIPWLQNEMLVRNIYFTLASDSNSGKPGIRPNTNKIQRFNIMVPQFKMNKIFFPTERKESPEIQEMINELSLATLSGFKSKHDDACSSGDTQIKELLYNKTIITRRFNQLVEDSVVESYNENTGKFEWVKVQALSLTGYKKTFTITLNDGNEIHLTDNHPVLTQRGWVNVGDLKEEDSIVCKSKNTAISGLKNLVGITSLQLISWMEQGIGFIKKYMQER